MMKIAWLRAFSTISRSRSSLSRNAACAPSPSGTSSGIVLGAPFRIVEMEIIGAELAGLHQPRQVRNGEALVPERDQAAGAQRLEHPVDMDRGEPAGIGDVALGQRKVA